MGSLWDHFKIILRPFIFGTILGSSWDHLGIILGAATGLLQPRRPRLHGEFVISNEKPPY